MLNALHILCHTVMVSGTLERNIAIVNVISNAGAFLIMKMSYADDTNNY